MFRMPNSSRNTVDHASLGGRSILFPRGLLIDDGGQSIAPVIFCQKWLKSFSPILLGGGRGGGGGLR